VEFHSSLFVNHELRITNYEFLTASFQTKVNHPEIVELNRCLTNIKYQKIKYQNYIVSVQPLAVNSQQRL